LTFILILFSYIHLGFATGLFHSDFPTKMLYAFLTKILFSQNTTIYSIM